jgi:diadenosine tetraphosphate (Ap4A) HIT family hydrolase
VNLKEGTRRLALLLGTAGAVLGGFASYTVLSDAWGARARYKEFELLANSKAAQREQNSWTLTLRYTPDRAIERFRKLPEAQQRDVFRDLAQEEQADLVAKLKCEPLPQGSPPTDATVENLLKDPIDPGWSLVLPHQDPIDEFIALSRDQQLSALQQLSPEEQNKLLSEVKRRETAAPAARAKYTIEDGPGSERDDPFACMADSGDPPTSTVNESGIKTIHWTKGLGVESIETEDGKTIYPSEAPNRWLYFLAAILPFVGFALPWGLIRAVGWVGAGFVTS